MMNNLQFINNLDPNIIEYNDNYYIVISNVFGIMQSPAYSIFIKVCDKIFENDNDVYNLFTSLINNDIDNFSSIILRGIENEFRLGHEYYISYSLYKYLTEYNTTGTNVVPSVIDDYVLLDYFDNQYNRINTDKYIDIADTDLHYYYNLNKLKDYSYSKEELHNFVSTFCGIILDNTKFTNIVDTKNLIYKYVLEYYRNNTKDSTSAVLDLIFNNNTLLNGITAGSTSTCCGTTQQNEITNMLNVINTTSVTNMSCKDIYDKSMFAYLIKMLGDHNFYCDWFYIDNNSEYKYPNLILVHKLKKLFEEFKDLDYLLYWPSEKTYDCHCNNNFEKNESVQKLSQSNYKILDNYYNILTYVEDDIVCENKNKITIYGENFANILPYIYYL